VLLWYYQSAAAENFRSAGLRVETIAPLRLGSYPELLLQLGHLTGKTASARALHAAFLEQLQKIQVLRVENPVRVCFELYSPGKIVGDQSYLGDLLRASGGCSINPGRSGLFSPERIVEAAPQIIFFVEGSADIAELSARNAYQSTPAVQAQRIHAVPRKLLIEGLEPIAAITFLRQKITTPQP